MNRKLLHIEKAILCGLLIAVTAALISGFSVVATQCNDVRHDVLRLHILANSDTKADQQLKLNVRNKILADSSELFTTAKNRAEAEKNVKTKLPEIEKIAQAEIKKEGYSYSVKARLVNMYFTTRTYGNVTLPAGYYDAVRVTIGAARGHNWWCVLFPPLCLPASGVTQSKMLSDVLSPGEVGVIKDSGKPTTVIKFKSIEMLEQMKNYLRTHGFNLV